MQPMFVRINSLNLKVLRDIYWNINKFFEVMSWYRTMWCKSWNVLNRWSWLVVIMFWAHSVARIQHLVNVTLANHYIQTGKSRFSLATELGCCVHCFLGWQQVDRRRHSALAHRAGLWASLLYLSVQLIPVYSLYRIRRPRTLRPVLGKGDTPTH